MALESCGLQLVVGYALGISTLAVVYAVRWMRSRSIVKKAMSDISREELIKQKKIAEAKKQIAQAKKVLAEAEKEEPKEEAVEEPSDAKYIEEEPKPAPAVKPKQKRTFFKKKEEPKENERQTIHIEE